MELSGFTPRENDTGDRLPAKEAADTPLILLVREHRTGVRTKYNSDPNQPGYKPEGSEAIVVDAANPSTDSVWIDVLWLNGAIVDNLAPYIGQALPIKLVWTASAKGGYPYLSVQALDGPELATAQQWANNNPNRFDNERVTRTSQQPAPPQQPAAQQPAAQQPAADPNDPAVQALLQQINQGHTPPAAS